ncbi:MAG: LLM class flavin-dependent oxidoreductase [Candidatus Binataceae bacterium]|nr:LLM class flavin-dependent oxidoreductase [Candidatus Binataceae bacterium]
MHIAYFSERPYHPLDEDLTIAEGIWGISNRHFDPVVGARLYNEYLDQAVRAEEAGYDGIVLNEHHGLVTCMGAVANIEAAILARITKRCKIIMLGNLPTTVGNPLRLAEELAEIDLISGGRLVSGFVRGGGTEQLSNGSNPAFNRELFLEAHDFIIKAWTTPGPFRHEGRHLHYRFVNPWALPLQKPHPPIWVPGLVSPETVRFCAERRYPYIALSTYLEPTVDLWDLYCETAAQAGYQAGPENFGYLQKVIVGETEDEARELAMLELQGGRAAAFGAIKPEFMFPSGYNSKGASSRMARQFKNPKGGPELFVPRGKFDVAEAKKTINSPEQLKILEDSYRIIVGTPAGVISKIKKILDVLRPGVFIIRHSDGWLDNKSRMKTIDLIGRELIPGLKEIGDRMGLVSPFERIPGSRPLNSPESWERVAQVGALENI